MKNIFKILFITGALFFLAFSCDKDDEIDCYKGEIIEHTCGGTVVKFLGDEIVGEDWDNYFSSPVKSYTNCVLAGNISEDYEKGDTIYFSYKKVKYFTGDNYCDIAGLPNTLIEVSKMHTDECAD